MSTPGEKLVVVAVGLVLVEVPLRTISGAGILSHNCFGRANMCQAIAEHPEVKGSDLRASLTVIYAIAIGCGNRFLERASLEITHA